ncbi:MAG: pyrC 2 [Anaerosporomusa subterranea]|nr:pyrC 2 [Anaerosporomusa subterranea]
MKLVIKGGHVVDPANGIEQIADIVIDGQKIIGVDLGLSDQTISEGAEIFDATGLVVCPGLIDMHVHLREPGLEAKEEIRTGSEAAAAGGFTAVACMPNTKPIVDNSIMVSGILERARREAAVHIHVIGALTKEQAGKELAEIGDMVQNGAVALSDDGHFVEDARVFQTGLSYASMFDIPVISHAEEESLAGEGCMHEGLVSTILGVKGRPAVAEEIAVARDILLAEYAKARLHIAHVSAAGAVELIRQAKRRGVKVTAEATPHHLSLTDEAVYGFNTATKVNPPLRSADHVRSLIDGLKDGTIDAIACDHAPHAPEEKDVEYRIAANGFTGLETSLGVILTALYHSKELTLNQIVQLMSVSPAAILGVTGGSLAPGATADITVFDPDKEWIVDSKHFYSKGKSTPFDGKTLKGKAVATVVAGQFVMKNGEVL